jgi:hypothetical protein
VRADPHNHASTWYRSRSRRGRFSTLSAGLALTARISRPLALPPLPVRHACILMLACIASTHWTGRCRPVRMRPPQYLCACPTEARRSSAVSAPSSARPDRRPLSVRSARLTPAGPRARPHTSWETGFGMSSGAACMGGESAGGRSGEENEEAGDVPHFNAVLSRSRCRQTTRTRAHSRRYIACASCRGGYHARDSAAAKPRASTAAHHRTQPITAAIRTR